MKPKAIDPKAVLILKDLGQKAGTNLLAELVVLFKEECPAAFSGIQGFLDDGELDRIPAVAHLMKSSCANLGALKLRDLFAEIEKCKTNPNAAAIRSLLQEAEQEYQLALEELQELSKS